ncbi:MAG: TetR/AcrR family transcriptional regulator [Myxococcales bacterium]|nr:TetR/AcrR family transcriptional regulator [Myxococcales bacterium]
MAQRRRASEVRQAELTDAALHIIATKGIAALTTRALAAEVGLTSGAIFRHFASLDALLDALVDRVEQVVEATYPAEQLAPAERLERFVEARSTAVGKQLGILRLVLSEQFLLALPQESSRRLGACVRKTRRFVRTCLEQAQAEGSVRSDLPAAALSPIVIGTIRSLALSHKRGAERGAEAKAVRETLMALLSGHTSRATS